MKLIKKQVPLGQLRTLIDESPNLNEESRTVELTWSTGSKGLRNGWDGPYYEELSMDPKHVDLTRLQAGAPLLASHDSQSLNSVIGVVERAWIEGDKGKALVRFSSDPDADRIYQKVKERVLRNVSVGYQVRKYEDATQKGDQFTTYRATNWLPHEISIVPIGFDPNAQVRSQDTVTTEVEIEAVEAVQEQETQTVNEEINKPVLEETEIKPTEEQRHMSTENKEASKVRAKEITEAVRAAKLEDGYALELITSDVTADEARKMVLTKLSETRATPTINPGAPSVEVTSTNEDKRREIFEDAVLARVMPSQFKVEGESRLLYGKNLLRQIESFVPRRSMESDAAYAKRTMMSSDLPLALANIAEKGLQKSYELAPRTFEQWTRKDTLRNYKTASQIKTGDYSSLVERAENADFTEGEFGEAQETVALKDHGKIHSFSSQMLVNDDLGVIAKIASQGGVAVSRLENKKAYAALTGNRVMSDGVTLYHASHGNLATAADITSASVKQAYLLMRMQKSTDGLDPLNLAPMAIVVGPSREAEARQFFAAINSTKVADTNIYQGQVAVIVDAEIIDDSFYFVANPQEIDTVVCYRLEGQEQPLISSRTKFENSSLQLKIEHAFVAEAMDWRGIVKNAGNPA